MDSQNNSNGNRIETRAAFGACVTLGLLVFLGDTLISQYLTFLLMVTGMVVIRRLAVLRACTDLVEILVAYQALTMLTWFVGPLPAIPSPFTGLAVGVLLILFNRFLRGREWQAMGLQWPVWHGLWKWAVLITVLSLCGLYIWYHYVLADRHPAAALVPPWPTVVLLAVAMPVTAMVNGVREEFIFRAILQTEARRVVGPAWAVAIQAVLFGTMHYRGGFPSGWIGVGLTVAFGTAMGILFHKSRSVWPCILVHTLCDAYIFSVIILDRPMAS